MASFDANLLTEILSSLENDFGDNHDHYRFGPALPNSMRERVKGLLTPFTGPLVNASDLLANYKLLDGYYDGFRYLYELLEDEKSKELLVKLVAFRILGHKRVKLPRNNEQFWKNLEVISTLESEEDTIDVNFDNWTLKRTNLSPLGIPIELYYLAIGTNCTFLLEQYKYEESSGEALVRARSGDTVMDLGGCWGDTALYFANCVGNDGKVFSFEFIPSNISIFKQNLALNPILQRVVNLIDRPVWHESDLEVFYTDLGPGSWVSFDRPEAFDGRVETISIDDAVQQNDINKVDFIKMDIEGAEPEALKGAVRTIEKFRPKLAISIYHNLSHFSQIPSFIDSLGLGYKFYLDHFTIHTDETILFALPSA